MPELSRLEQEIMEVVVDQHAETRRGTTHVIIKAALGARSGQQRARIDDALVAMCRRGLLVRGPAGLVPAAPAVVSAEATQETVDETSKLVCMECGKELTADERRFLEIHCNACEHLFRHDALEAGSEEEAPADCQACGSREGQYHSPECGAVNAFTAGRIQGDGTGQALPPMEYPATVERIEPETLPPDLINRCAAMHMTLLAQAQADYAQGKPGADRELTWLIETGRQLIEAGGAHAQA